MVFAETYGLEELHKKHFLNGSLKKEGKGKERKGEKYYVTCVRSLITGWIPEWEHMCYTLVHFIV